MKCVFEDGAMGGSPVRKELLGRTFPKNCDLVPLQLEYEALRNLLIRKGVIEGNELVEEREKLESQTREVEI